MAVAEGKGRDPTDFSALPEGCIARVVFFTSPADACRLADVSSIFKSACDSVAVWASFLLPDGLPERFVAEAVLLQPMRRPGSHRRWQNELFAGQAQWEEMCHAICEGPVYSMGRCFKLLVLESHGQLQVCRSC